MNKFSQLYYDLERQSSTDSKVAILAHYLAHADTEEFSLAVYLLGGGSLRGAVRSNKLREWAAHVVKLPAWLIEESYSAVGDLAETIALLIASSRKQRPNGEKAPSRLTDWAEAIYKLRELTDDERQEAITQLWSTLSDPELLVFNKLLTGGLRIGVSKGLVVRGLARALGVKYEELCHRLAGNWEPARLSKELLTQPNSDAKSASPYPFFLAYPVEPSMIDSFTLSDWQVEWKWDGIRAQLVSRGPQVAIWSRGEELISESFPELMALAKELAVGTVLDGEIVAWSGAHPAPFTQLQRRLNRRKITPKLLTGEPVIFIAYDILEHRGADVRKLALSERRTVLDAVVNELKAATVSEVNQLIRLSPIVKVNSLEELKELRRESRLHFAEGFMLKRLDAHYGIGRTDRGAWWKWKVEPLTVDAVLIYAQMGHGRRAGRYTDYTFGVWGDGGKLVTFAKAYSGLNDEEINQVDAFIKANTIERFGPVRTVRPELVFEIGFEGIAPSKRHRSGVAVRFPRILRWRRDKPASEAETLEGLRKLVS